MLVGLNMSIFSVAIFFSLLNCFLSYDIIEEPLLVQVDKPLRTDAKVDGEYDPTKCSKTSNLLKWVTYKQWENMPGGTTNNPEVRTWKGNASIRQLYDEDSGCWQTGNQNGDPALGLGELGCEAANDGKTFQSKRTWKKGTCRALVNPGNAVKYRWIEGEKGMRFPANTVCGDSRCKLRVATYYDSRNLNGVAPIIKNPDGRAQAAQADENGYVYYFDETWQWDDNEYRLLEIVDVEKVEVIKKTFKKGGTEDVKTEVLQEDRLVNHHDSVKAELRSTLTFKTDTVVSWNRGISLDFGASWSIEGTAGVVKASQGYSLNLGLQYTEGGSETETVTFSKTVVAKDIEPNTEVRVVMAGTRTTKKDVPYEFDVKITFKDGTQRIVKDYGTVSTLEYSEVHAKIL